MVSQDDIDAFKVLVDIVKKDSITIAALLVSAGVAKWKPGIGVGVAVDCTVCHRRKKPVGRSAPMEMANSICDSDCSGYYEEPKPRDLWPGETREEYGY